MTHPPFTPPDERCPADGSPLVRFLRGVQAGCTLARCGRCGLVWTLPLLAPSELPALYADRLSKNFQPSDHRAVAAVKDRIAARQLRWMRSLMGRLPASMLDYGTGNGRYAAQAVRLGWPEVVACDWHAEPPAGLPAPYVTTSALAERERQFDFVLLRAVLEHAADPHAMLSEVRGLLRPGGVVYVEVPNVESWSVRLFGMAAQPLFLPFHRVHFTAQTLDATVRQSGLQPIASGYKTMPKIADQLQHAVPALPRLAAQVLGAASQPLQLLLERTLGRENLWVMARRPT